MKETVRENYFLVLKMLMALVLLSYVIIETRVLSGASSQVLLLSAFFIVAVTGEGLSKGRKQRLFLLLEGLPLILLAIFVDRSFVFLLVMWILDIVLVKNLKIQWYLLSYLVIAFSATEDTGIHFLIVTCLIVVYFQNGVIIRSYQSQLKENEQTEQKLKKVFTQKETVYQEQISKGLLAAENRILEEKTRLSQALHDKLGHSINGSVYQLEACKVLMEKEPKTCEAMIQAVLDNLRGSMDEIREILRKGRPDKYKIAILQLQSLCDDCIKMGINAAIFTQGNFSDIPDKFWEIILDNTFEAISNALKYAKCTKIEIKIIVMNKLVRCSISDNGVGCNEIIDGMGITGMRKRVRSVNGILDFDSFMGFSINMLLPFE